MTHRATFLALAAVVLLTAAFTQAALAKGQRFLVIDTHTPDQCLADLDALDAKGEKPLAQFDWGCMAGNHKGYAILEAKDEAAVRAMLPAGWKDVQILMVGKFTREQIKSFHEKMKK
ncbi:MAG: hypothetical protein C4326_03680 [Ignavibacteria bacterium]